MQWLNWMGNLKIEEGFVKGILLFHKRLLAVRGDSGGFGVYRSFLIRKSPKVRRTHHRNRPASIFPYRLRLHRISQKVLNVATATPPGFSLILLVSLENAKFRFRHIYEMGSNPTSATGAVQAS